MIRVRRVSSLFLTPLPLFCVGLCLFAALVYGRRDLAFLSLLVLSLSAGLKLWARSSPSAIGWRQTIAPTRVFAGETCAIRARVENGKFLPVFVDVEIPVSGPPGEESSFTGEASLLWRQAARFGWEMRALRRGVSSIGPATIATGDLFGFFSREHKREEAVELMVYPRLVPVKEFPLPRRDFFGTPGGDSPADDPCYILGTTDYRHGRPARFIHWKASARHDRLQEKVFESTEQAKVLLVIDVDGFSPPPGADAFERTLEVAASLAVRLDREGCAVGLATNGVTEGASPVVPVSRSALQLPAILEAMARLAPDAREAVADMLGRNIRIPWGTGCLYFTYEEDRATALARECLKARRVPVLFFTFQSVLDLLIEPEQTGLKEGTTGEAAQGGAGRS